MKIHHSPSPGPRVFAAVVTILAATSFFSPKACSSTEELFPEPDILRDNVLFWKHIYTVYGLDQGVLHDRDYPLVVFDTLDITGLSPKKKKELIEARKNPIVQALSRADSLHPDSLSPAEKAMAALYGPAGKDALPGAFKRVRFQQGQKERFRRGLERSGRYLDTIRVILAREGVPERLAFLPHVESSFDADAYSKVGAAGLWQFMRGTGRNYMRIDYLIDERCDPIRSTVAAAKLLAHSHRVLESWPLAITSYNHGLNGIAKAVRTLGTRDIAEIIRRHESASFKFVSKNFYACFLAASDIARDPLLWFPDLSYEPPFIARSVTFSNEIRPTAITRLTGIPISVIRELNPSLRPAVFKKDAPVPAGYVLRFPAVVSSAVLALAAAPARSDSGTAAPETLALLAPKPAPAAPFLPAKENEPVRKRPAPEKDISAVPAISLKPDPSAAAIAQIPVTISPAASPPISLPVYGPSEVPDETAGLWPFPFFSSEFPALLPDSVRVSAAPAAPTVPGVEADTPAARAKSLGPDTLKTVASRLHSPQPIAPPLVVAGSALPDSGFDPGVYNFSLRTEEGRILIQVSVGETIGHYAMWLGVSGTAVRRANGMGGGGAIRIGQPLALPVREGGAAAFQKARLEYHMANEEDFFSEYRIAGLRTAKIQRGDSPWSLCRRESSTPLWLFKKYNPALDFNAFMPGKDVQIPVIISRNALEGPAETPLDDPYAPGWEF